MKNFARVVGSLSIVAMVIVGTTTATVASVGCSSTCSSDEEQACTATFNTCIQNAVTSTSKADCEACATNYCKCYDDCGTDCNPDDHKAGCGSL